MRICQSCGRENPSERDFCECGEYLRWDPTGFVEAVTPEMAAAAAAEPPAVAAPPAPPAPPPAPEPVAAGPAKTQVHAAAPPPPAAEPAHEPATITLRLPDDDAAPGETLALGVHPGERARVRALIRNQSGIVDNYQLSVLGLPDGWFSVLPDTVYLVPYGSGGTYEQEVEIHFHPPRTAEAEARIWELQVAAHSRAQERIAATAPLLLGIQPFEQHETKVKPERASGRRKADFKVAVRNKANAPVYVAFAAKEADDDCRFAFTPPAVEIAPGETVETRLRVRPPKQIWIGRPHERRLDVQTRSGDEARALDAAAVEENGHDGGDLGGKLRGEGIPGVDGPKLYKPQVHKPDVHLGPGGVQVQKPMVRGPQMVGPQARGMNLSLSKLKLPGGQAPPAVSGPLLPTQAVFRQQPWLPWWVAIVVPLLALLALLLFLFLPKNVEVPDVVGKKSAFEAEQAITEAGLKLAPKTNEKVDGKVPPGTVVGQTPEPGATAEEDSEVAILVAIGTGKASVPNVVGQTPVEAERTLRKAGLTLGQATPQPVDPKATIKSQIPEEKDILAEGAPVDIFLAVEKAAAGGKKSKDDGKDGAAAAPGDADGGGGGGGGGGPVVVPAIDGASPEAYAQKAGDAGLLPQPEKAFHESDKGTLFRVEPAPGDEVEPGTPVKLFVSAGFPALAYDNDKDVLLVNAADGAKLDPIADGSQVEDDPTWSADGSRVAYTSDNRVFVKDVEKPDSAPDALTAKGERFTDLAWAPTVEVDALAMVKRSGGDLLSDAETQLCFGRIKGDRMSTSCKPASTSRLGRKLNWSSDGKSLLAFAASPAGDKLGMVRFRSDKPFSTDQADWKSDGFVTDVSKPGEGVLDAALSPDGRRLAVVRMDGNGRAELYMTKPRDLLLSNADPLGVRACKVVWRPDGKNLVIVRADECLAAPTGDLLRLPVGDPKSLTALKLNGDNPAFQPLAAE